MNREERFCIHCKEKFEVRKSNKKIMCSEKCRKEWASLSENIMDRIDKSKKAIRKKFGVENVFQLDTIKKKSKRTKFEKYGDENYNNANQMVATRRDKYGNSHFVDTYYDKTQKRFEERLGVSHPLKLEEFKNKQKQTVLEKYGVPYISNVQAIRNKAKKTMIERYGVDNASKSEEIKQKKRETSLRNFGVEHHLKDARLLRKHFIAMCKVKKYKDTDLYYQGSYELYFLEKMEQDSLLSEISNGRSYEYEWNGKKHTYHTDFVFREIDIEIKSGWTYNNNGTNILLQEVNKTKWRCARSFGSNLSVLIDKPSIDVFVNSL